MSEKTAVSIDYDKLLGELEKCCESCDLYGSDRCIESGCLVGFAKKSVKYGKIKNSLSIPGAENLIPGEDFKVYDKEGVSGAIAETCRQCRQCWDNHTEDCIIALVRKCLELTTLEDNIVYPGSVVAYIMELKKRDQNLADMVHKKLQ